MSESKLTSKGQITIPKAVRERLNLELGDTVAFVFKDDGSVVLQARNLPWERLKGMFRKRGRPRVSIEQMSPERAGADYKDEA